MGQEQAKGTFSEPETFASPQSDVGICRLNAEEMNEFLREENTHLLLENAKFKAITDGIHVTHSEAPETLTNATPLEHPQPWRDCKLDTGRRVVTCKDANGKEFQVPNPIIHDGPGLSRRPETRQLKPPVGRPTCECPDGHSCFCKWN